jgi:hypothetical protein
MFAFEFENELSFLKPKTGNFFFIPEYMWKKQTRKSRKLSHLFLNLVQINVIFFRQYTYIVYLFAKQYTPILTSIIYLLESTCFSVMKGDLVLEFNRNSLASRSIWT